MTLSLYLARRFLMTFAMVFTGFFILLFLFDLIEEVRRHPQSSVNDLAGLAMLHTPGSIYNILPLLMVLAAIALFLRLARSSELVAIRATGQSALRTLAAPVLAALSVGLFAVTIFNPIVAATTKRYEFLSNAGGGTAEFSVGSDGLWLRQGGADGQWVIRAGGSNPDGTELFDVSLLAFDTSGAPAIRIEAAAARQIAGVWTATDAKEWRFVTGDNPEASARRHDSLVLATQLTADQIRNSVGAPSTVSVWDMPAFIIALDRAGFSSRRHAVWFQMELAMPLLLAAMVLVGAGFTMRHTRFGQTGQLVLLALVSGIAIFFIRNFAQVLGESGQIPVLLAAWTPPIAATLLSVSLLLHLEDG